MGGVHVPAMRQQESALDLVAKGLQIAQSVYGLKTAYDKKQDDDAKAADEKAGVLSRSALLDHVKGQRKVDPGTPGARTYKVRENDQVLEESYLTLPKEDKDGLVGVETVDEKGNAVTKYVKPSLGLTLPKPKKEEKPPKDITVQERNTLQNQYDRDPEVRKAKTVLDSYASTQKLLEQKTPASDLALVYNYMKALDPNSVVRETEAETAAALGGLMERAKAQMSNMSGDGMLTDAQRADLARQIESLAGSAGDRLDEIDAQFSDLAKRRNVDMKDLRLTGRSVRPKSGNQAGKSTYRPGTILDINGKRYRVEQDGDTLTEIPAVSGK